MLPYNKEVSFYALWYNAYQVARKGQNVFISNDSLKWVLHPQLKIKMFCTLSQNYQHFFLKNNVCILKQKVQGIKNKTKQNKTKQNKTKHKTKQNKN